MSFATVSNCIVLREVVYGRSRNMIAETINTAAPRHYLWGLDISGTGQGAGGVGGLLGYMRGATWFIPLYDANGNVMGYVNATLGRPVINYEFDAYGNLTSGNAISIFRHRFSTKYLDTETGLYYYGRRFYDPIWGRWINRDPIEEQGGLNLYAFCGNDAVNAMDLLGMITLTNIPRIMRTKGWNNGATLMEHWLGGSKSTDKTTIKMDSWVLGFNRAKNVYDKIVADKVYVNSAAKEEIIKLAKKKCIFYSGGSFDSLDEDVETLNEDYVQYRSVGSLFDPLDDMFAALGKFTLRVLVEGEVSVKGVNRCFRINRIGIYVHDSYDFNGDQNLGYWNDKTNYAGRNPLKGDKVTNAHFRAHTGGGDFIVFSDIKIIELDPIEEFSSRVPKRKRQP